MSVACAARRPQPLACRLVALRPNGDVINHRGARPAPWHEGADQCMVKLNVMDALPDGLRDSIGVQFRGPKDEIKALVNKWNSEHAAESDGPKTNRL